MTEDFPKINDLPTTDDQTNLANKAGAANISNLKISSILGPSPMTPVAEVQVIEGVSEGWKTSLSTNNNNNNNNNDHIRSSQISDTPNGDGEVNEEYDSSESSRNDEVDSEDPQSPAGLAAGQAAVYSTEYVNGFNTGYPEPYTNGDTQMNGFHETQPLSSDETVSTENLSPKELARLVRHQFEYYFSRENLTNDVYLVSQMDDDQYVAIATVAGFKQIKKLTSDLEFIVDSLKESPYIQLDSTCSKVRANMKRCIVILREIPEATPIEEIEQLFTSEKCPKWSSCEFVNNDSWYVTFASEEDAQKAFQYIRQDVGTFQGRPIMARIKAKTLLSRTVFMPKNGARSDSMEQEVTPFSGQQQFPSNGFHIQPPAFQQPPYQYYVPTTAWLSSAHPHFYSQEGYSGAASNFQSNTFTPNNVKSIPSSSQRQFQLPGRSRQPNGRGGYHRDSISDKSSDKEATHPSSYRRQQSGSSGINHSSVPFRKESEVPPRRQSLKKQDVPRFQRLRQDRERRQLGLDSKKAEEQVSSINLAPENFPALPSPKSPSCTEHFSNLSVQDAPTSPSAASAPEISGTETVVTFEASSEECSIEDVKIGTVESFEMTTTPGKSKALSPPIHDSRMSYAQMAQRPFAKTMKDTGFTNDNNITVVKGANNLSITKTKISKTKMNGVIDASSNPIKNFNALSCDDEKFPVPGFRDSTNESSQVTSSIATIANKNSNSTPEKESYAAKSIQNLRPVPKKLDLNVSRSQLLHNPPISPVKENGDILSGKQDTIVNGCILVQKTEPTTPTKTAVRATPATENYIKPATNVLSSSETEKSPVNVWMR